MIEAVKEITIGGMATLALFANIMSICLIVIALLWFLIKVLKNGRGLKQAPQLLQFVVLWICGAAHTSFCNCQMQKRFFGKFSAFTSVGNKKHFRLLKPARLVLIPRFKMLNIMKR